MWRSQGGGGPPTPARTTAPVPPGEIRHKALPPTPGRSEEEVAESAVKPGSVVDRNSSRRIVTDTLEQPTRTRRGPRHEVPIWSCSRWGLPCRSVARLAVRSYRTVSPLPRTPGGAVRRSAFCCTFRRLAPPRRYLAPCPVEPGLSSAPASRRMAGDATVWPTPPRALSHADPPRTRASWPHPRPSARRPQAP